ncbi:MAG: 3-deoxy-D-manno-octulosonate 8-phosphate phosphatase, YrbI family [Betaproteobacteria bacterium]|nr:3-deoxy-D-manno-octulosonate 8-phosphate phosphatase, YrbI family [Betaproteobacteria bacterium]
MADDLIARLQPLKLMAFDVDGVLTDGRLYYTDDGVETKTFHALDGQGMNMLRDAGLKLALITSRRSPLVERRARDLGLHYCHQGVSNKREALDEIIGELKLKPEQSGFMGDDLFDLGAMLRAGFAASVPTAPAAVRERSHYVTARAGGDGAVREVCELILQAQGSLERLIAEYLK